MITVWWRHKTHLTLKHLGLDTFLSLNIGIRIVWIGHTFQIIATPSPNRTRFSFGAACWTNACSSEIRHYATSCRGQSTVTSSSTGQLCVTVLPTKCFASSTFSGVTATVAGLAQFLWIPDPHAHIRTVACSRIRVTIRWTAVQRCCSTLTVQFEIFTAAHAGVCSGTFFVSPQMATFVRVFVLQRGRIGEVW